MHVAIGVCINQPHKWEAISSILAGRDAQHAFTHLIIHTLQDFSAGPGEDGVTMEPGLTGAFAKSFFMVGALLPRPARCPC
jgi:hypothetical protein